MSISRRGEHPFRHSYPIQKCVRIDSRTERLIMSYRGRNFSDKLRKLCRDLLNDPGLVREFLDSYLG